LVASEFEDLLRCGRDVTAHEHEDDEDTMDKKVTFLASLMQRSRRTVLCSGAGIGTGSSMADYATRYSDADGSSSSGGGGGGGSSSSSSELQPISPVLAQPTPSHRLLDAMHKWI
jgi:hypothetical protein